MGWHLGEAQIAAPSESVILPRTDEADPIRFAPDDFTSSIRAVVIDDYNIQQLRVVATPSSLQRAAYRPP